jgi:hypothetical protein
MSSVMTVGLPRRCLSGRGDGSAPTLVITCSEIPAFAALLILTWLMAMYS